MSEFNFQSSICTSKEQSERLLALGLKKETADMALHFSYVDFEGNAYYSAYPIGHKCTGIPAWSMHRLLCLYGADYEIKEVYNNAEECYGMLICAIEIAIENGDFNEEYLER